MTLPNFVIIGAAKAGTTALYWYLAEHPDVFMSPLKETNYLAYALDGSGALVYGDPELHRFRIRNREDYESLFADAGDAIAIGEASPIYLECPQTPQRILELLPEARMICGVRDPVDRAYSDYQMYLRNRGLRLDPANDLTLDAAWAQPGSHWMKIGRYHDMLSRYLALMPQERLHVYLFDDMRRNTLQMVQEIYRFIDVDASYAPDLETPHNVGGVPARMGLEKLLTSKRLRSLVEPLIPSSLVDLARRVRTANLEKAPPLPAEMRKRMVAYFEDDIRQTEELLGRELSAWLV